MPGLAQRRTRASLAALALLLVACGSSPSAPLSRGSAPPVIVCGKVLYQGANLPILRDAAGPSIAQIHESAGATLLLRISNSCHGVRFEMAPTSCAMVTSSVKDARGATIAVNLDTSTSRCNFDVEANSIVTAHVSLAPD